MKQLLKNMTMKKIAAALGTTTEEAAAAIAEYEAQKVIIGYKAMVNWDKTGEPPRLPQDVIDRTSEKYVQAYEKITGRKF